ncbi:mesoderm induction early response protein 2 isoform X2 [Pseudorasbora parva]|uniref:mesoderm induction early response protein 2 isoform X2 n=1 Tax=Pseudorasbora parva TaxID=51549 RepID=UPI00351DDDDE
MAAVRMGSKDQRYSRVDIFHQGYAGPLEALPRASTFLEEQDRTLAALRRQAVKMATKTHSGGDMPLEQLLALYGYNMPDPVLEQPNELAASLPEMTLDKVQTGKDLLSGGEDVNTHSSADDLTLSLTSHASDLLQSHLRGDDKDTSVSCSEDDSESNSIPSSDGRKDIMVGPQYQAIIPALCTHTFYERAYENEDQLLWTPDVLSSLAAETFLLEVQRKDSDNGPTNSLTTGDIVKDNEQALYELVKCNFNAEEALRRYRFNVKVFNDLCAWSEEECRSFEHGYRAYGKNFHLIQGNKVRTRSVGECVEYYYMWKKSERHEYFTQQATKMGRKKCNLPSGNTEDAEPDGDTGDVEGANHGLPTRSSIQLQPPSPPAAMELDKQGSERNIGELELCAGSCSSPQGEQLFRQFPPLTQVLQMPDRASPSTQLYFSSLHLSHSVPSSQLVSRLLGGGLYQLQPGSFPEDPVPARSEYAASRRLQIDFSLPSSPVSSVPDFGVLGSLLCSPSSICPTPMQHSNSPIQRMETFHI